MSAAGPLVAKFVGRSADGLICTSGKTSEFYDQTVLPNLKAWLSDSGRPDSAMERMIEMNII